MRFLKKNRLILYISFGILPVFFLDRSIISWMQDSNKYSQALMAFIRAIDPLTKFLSNGATLMAGSLLVYLSARYLDKEKLRQASGNLLVGLISSGIIVQVLKHLAGRARPRITHENIFIGPSLKNDYDSFPSGHTTLAFCLAFILSGYYPRYRFIFYAFAVMVCLHRLEGPSHFPSDILAGALLGTLVGSSIARSNLLEKDLASSER